MNTIGHNYVTIIILLLYYSHNSSRSADLNASPHQLIAYLISICTSLSDIQEIKLFGLLEHLHAHLQAALQPSVTFHIENLISVTDAVFCAEDLLLLSLLCMYTRERALISQNSIMPSNINDCKSKYQSST